MFHIGHEPGWFFDKWYATGHGDGISGGNAAPGSPSEQSEVSVKAAVALRSGFEFALPLAGYATSEDRRSEQEAKYRAFGAQFTEMLKKGGSIYTEAGLFVTYSYKRREQVEIESIETLF